MPISEINRVPVCCVCVHCNLLLLFLHVPCSVGLLREELQLLQEQGSHVGEVIKPMDKKKVLVKVHFS